MSASNTTKNKKQVKETQPQEGKKVTSNHRLTPEGKRLLVLLAKHLGLDQTGVIETLIREKARSEGLK
jgi:hypothetical protein